MAESGDITTRAGAQAVLDRTGQVAPALLRAVAGIDLGSATGTGNTGRNTLQTQAGGNPNVGAGICVDLATGAGAQALTAVGNQFAGRDCTATAPGVIKTSTSCTGATDLGVTVATGTTVTVNTRTCTQPTP